MPAVFFFQFRYQELHIWQSSAGYILGYPVEIRIFFTNSWLPHYGDWWVSILVYYCEFLDLLATEDTHEASDKYFTWVFSFTHFLLDFAPFYLVWHISFNTWKEEKEFNQYGWVIHGNMWVPGMKQSHLYIPNVSYTFIIPMCSRSGRNTDAKTGPEICVFGHDINELVRRGNMENPDLSQSDISADEVDALMLTNFPTKKNKIKIQLKRTTTPGKRGTLQRSMKT